jgi:hypothetical protein
MAELRNEIKTVIAANDGIPSTHALFEMKLLDSVMKESQRTNPGSLGTCSTPNLARWNHKHATVS